MPEYIALLRPRMFLIENVPALLSHREGQTFKAIILAVERPAARLRYRVEYGVYDAAASGTPQARKRVLIFGVREGSGDESLPDPAPDLASLFAAIRHSSAVPEHLQEYYGALLDPRTITLTTASQALSDLPALGAGDVTEALRYATKPKSAYQRWARVGAPRVLSDTRTPAVTSETLKRLQRVPPGGCARSIPDRSCARQSVGLDLECLISPGPKYCGASRPRKRPIQSRARAPLRHRFPTEGILRPSPPDADAVICAAGCRCQRSISLQRRDHRSSGACVQPALACPASAPRAARHRCPRPSRSAPASRSPDLLQEVIVHLAAHLPQAGVSWRYGATGNITAASATPASVEGHILEQGALDERQRWPLLRRSEKLSPTMLHRSRASPQRRLDRPWRVARIRRRNVVASSPCLYMLQEDA